MASASASAEVGSRGLLRVAVLASGRGSNLAALIAARDRGVPFDLVGVISDRREARALERARQAGVRAIHVDRGAHESELAFQRALFAELGATSPDLVVCAGFMRIIRARFIESAPPMINIHPSLLPLHRGLHTHQSVLDSGEREHGASVHRVTADLDAGPVLAQVRMDVKSDDDAASLAARLLPLEHQLLVACVSAIAGGDLLLPDPEGVCWKAAPLRSPLRLDPSTGDFDEPVLRTPPGCP